jgi:chemotaxis protein histidine kinase CheA/ActR/RegA family two-component response regulator
VQLKNGVRMYDAEIILSYLDEEVANYIPQMRDYLLRLLVKPKDREAMEECYRLAHTIKGTSATLELMELSREGQAIEQALQAVTERKETFTPQLAQTLQARLAVVERLMNDTRRSLLSPAELPPVEDTRIGAKSAPLELGTETPAWAKQEELELPPIPEELSNAQKSADDWLNFSLFDNDANTPPPFLQNYESTPPSTAFLEAFGEQPTRQARISMPYPNPVFEPEDPKAFRELEEALLDDETYLMPERQPTAETTHRRDANSFTMPTPAIDPVVPAWLQDEPPDLPSPPVSAHDPRNRMTEKLSEPSQPLIRHQTDSLRMRREIQQEAANLSDILSTDTVDEQIDRLQQEILPLIPTDLVAFETLPIASDIVATDAALLESLGNSLTPTGNIGMPKELDKDEFDFLNEKITNFAEVEELFREGEPDIKLPDFGELHQTFDQVPAVPDNDLLDFKLEEDFGEVKTADFDDESLSELHRMRQESIKASGLDEEEEEDDGFNPGALFLAEAHKDLERLRSLIVNLNSPSAEPGAHAEIQQTATMMRKAADMMNLDEVSRQLQVIEALSDVVEDKMLPLNHSKQLLENAFDKLLELLEPYQEAAEAILRAEPLEAIEEKPTAPAPVKTAAKKDDLPSLEELAAFVRGEIELPEIPAIDEPDIDDSFTYTGKEMAAFFKDDIPTEKISKEFSHDSTLSDLPSLDEVVAFGQDVSPADLAVFEPNNAEKEIFSLEDLPSLEEVLDFDKAKPALDEEGLKDLETGKFTDDLLAAFGDEISTGVGVRKAMEASGEYNPPTEEEDPELAAIRAEILGVMPEDEALDDGEFDMGALFLAEATADLEKLRELITGIDGNSKDDGTADKIERTTATMRKAAEMMGLDDISRQLQSIEALSEVINNSMLPVKHSKELLANAYDKLIDSLAPYQAGAQAFLAPPELSDEEMAEFAEESAQASEAETNADAQAGFEGAVLALPAEEKAVEIVSEGQTQGSAPTPSTVTRPAAAPVEVDEELAEVFASEADEHIQNLDSQLAQLERTPKNREIIREIRRTAHTLKGSAAMVGFNTISQTAHLMEDLLDRLFDGTKEVNAAIISLLFQTFNSIEGQTKRIKSGHAEDPSGLEALAPLYAAVLEGTEEEEQGEGGMIIFNQPTVAEPAPQAVLIQESDIEAIEAEQAKAKAIEEAAEAMEQSRAVAVPQAVQAQALDIEVGVRVPIKRLDAMMNQVGELVINRTVMEQRSQNFARTIEELSLTIKRLQRVAREFETRYEVEFLKSAENVPVGTIAGNGASGNGASGNGSTTDYADFDTLEMDRYTEFHQVTREMTETVSDLTAAQKELDNLRDEFENITVQQGRISDDLQDRLVKVRLVPLSNLTPRLYRTIKTIATGQGKDIQFEVLGDSTPVDKTIFEEIGDPLLHIIRNAVDHGVETPEERIAKGKPAQATITFAARADGANVIIEVRDDGRGIDREYLRKKGVEKGFLSENSHPTGQELYNLMFLPGFSTARTISEISGRGVGLDVVRSNILKLKGVIEVTSEVNEGTIFVLRLPTTLAITRAALVKSGNFTYAIPLASIERTVKLEQGNIEQYGQHTFFELEGDRLPVVELNKLLHLPLHLTTPDYEDDSSPKAKLDKQILILGGVERRALQVDSLIGQQEIVVKGLGNHLKFVPGITGATILGSGQIILILNIYELMAQSGLLKGRTGYLSAAQPPVKGTFTAASTIMNDAHASAREAEERRYLETRALTPSYTMGDVDTGAIRRTPIIQVVDDSLSMRKVLSSSLEKAGFRVRTSKDGQEALENIQQSAPDLIIMDIEMPRMDGYQLTYILKNQSIYKHIPIVMLTSRAGLKHREKAQEVGADGFLIKPYKEDELLQIVGTLLRRATV